nr:diacylglycerol o-acyltransferase 2 [Chaetoceros muellerii]
MLAYHGANSPLSPATTVTTRSNSAFERLAEHKTKSYSLRQLASNSMERDTMGYTGGRRLSRDPSPHHERLTRHETISSSMKRVHKSQLKESSNRCPFYTYVNPKTEGNKALHSSDTTPIHSSTKKQPDVDVFPSRVINMGSVPNKHSLQPPVSSLTRSNSSTENKIKSLTLTREQQHFPKQDHIANKMSASNQQHYYSFKVREVSPMRPFHTLVTPGSFKGDDISEITDSGMRFTPPPPISSLYNATLSSASHDDKLVAAAAQLAQQNQPTATSAVPTMSAPKDDSLYYNAEMLKQRRQDLDSKQNALYERLAYQDTVSSSRIKSSPFLKAKLLSNYEKKRIEEEKAAKIKARRQRSSSVQPPGDQVFERLTAHGIKAALTNQMILKLVQEQKDWMLLGRQYCLLLLSLVRLDFAAGGGTKRSRHEEKMKVI